MRFECTENDFRVFEQLVEQDFLGSFPYFLELVLLGEKPATIPSAYGELEFAEEKIRDMGLEIKQVELEFVELEDVPDHARKPGKMFFVGREGDIQGLNESYTDRESYRRDFGLVMGYPKKDVEWFLTQEEEAYDNFSSEIEGFDDLIGLIAYVPKPEEENLEKARETAERYKNALKTADEKFDSDVGKKLLLVLKENQ